MVERRPSKPFVAGSSPVSRFIKGLAAHVAQLVEHVLGKDGVTSSNLVVGLTKAYILELGIRNLELVTKTFGWIQVPGSQ